jgi:putative phage-type endonuclease
MRIACKEQHTAEWHQARTGRVTASNISRAMAFLKRASGAKKAGDSSADRDKYIMELATELITRQPADHYVSKAMEIGTQFEGEARTEYWMSRGEEVDETGFVLHPTIDFLGASPDGLCHGHGLEIKVPMIHTHMAYLRADVVPEDYIPQMQCGMLCCGLPEWDFVSYCPAEVYPEVPDRFRLFVKRLEADPEMHHQMEEAAISTMTEAAQLVEQLTKLYPDRQRKERKEAGRVYQGEEAYLSDEDIARYI